MPGNKWEYSEKALNFDAGDNRRRLLVGILDKDVYGNRSWCPMYGYTEITPNRIRVNKIISSDGKTWFDLVKNEIAGRINFLDGLISGLIGVAGETGKINAGMNGKGTADDAIRFWAGATEANMANAPFRVQNDGKVFMHKAEIFGSSNIYGYLLNGLITITNDNVQDFLINIRPNYSIFNFKEYGGFVYFKDEDAYKGCQYLPFIDRDKGNDLETRDAIKYIGKYHYIRVHENVFGKWYDPN